MKSKKLLTVIAALSSIVMISCNKTNSKDSNDVIEKEKDDVESISTTKSIIELVEGEREQIEVVITPTDVKNKNVTYKSNDENIASVTSSGLVIAFKEGETSIVITSIANEKATTTVAIKVSKKVIEDTTKHVTSITASVESSTMQVSDAQKISVAFTPSDATNKEVVYSYDENAAVVSVSQSGNITALKEGDAEITIISKDNSKATSKVNIHVVKRSDENPFIHVTAIAINPTSIEKEEGKTQQLNVTLTGENGKQPTVSLVEYESSNPSVAVVDSKGLVTCLKKGSCTITVKSVSDPTIKQTVTVTVSEKPQVIKTKVLSVSLSGLDSTYDINTKIDFSMAKLTLTLDDNTTIEYTNGEADVTPENAKDSTQFIIHTGGLSSQGQLNEGVYQLAIEILDSTYDHRNLYTNVFTINIIANVSSKYNLLKFDEPENIVMYKKKLADSHDESFRESNFKVQQDCYAIGDDNAFIYKPDILLQKKGTTSIQTASINLDAKVVEVNDDNSLGSLDVGDTIYSFDQSTSSFKFTSSAVGHKYQIQIKQTDFDQINSIAGGKDKILTLNVKVNDGYNAYTALDLGRMNLFDKQQGRNDYQNQTVSLYYHEPYKNELDITRFYDPNTDDKFIDKQHTAYIPDVWKEYLESREEENLNEINGIFLQNDIKVTKNDLPEKFFISEEESMARVGDKYSAGSLRDWSYLYTHCVDIADFDMNGNCFNIDLRELPISLSNSAEKGTFVYPQNKSCEHLSNTAAFVFVNKLDNSSTFKAKMENISTIGNSNGSSIEMAGSIAFLKSSFGVTEVNNVISRNYNIGFFGNGCYGNKTLDIRNSKLFDCFTSGSFIFGSNKNTISSTEMKRFGGPCLFLDSLDQTDYKVADQGQTQRPKVHLVGEAGVNATEDCQFESLVSGTEPWFAINSATPVATQIKQLFTTLNSKCVTIEENGRMNMIAIGLDKETLKSTAKTRVNFNYGGYPNFTTSTTDSQDQASLDNQSPNASEAAALSGILYKEGSCNPTDVASTASEFRTTFPAAFNMTLPMIKTCKKNGTSNLYYLMPAGQSLPENLYSADITTVAAAAQSGSSISSYSPTSIDADMLQALLQMNGMEAALVLGLYSTTQA